MVDDVVAVGVPGTTTLPQLVYNSIHFGYVYEAGSGA